MNEESIFLEDIYRIYSHPAGDVYALNGINFKAYKGESIAIVGPSGSGKSTMLNIFGCLDRPSRGHVWIDGINTGELSSNQLAELRRDKIGFVFQSYNLIPTLTAIENVELVLCFKGINSIERRRRAKQLLAAVGLEDCIDRRPNELSGGQQQRVAIGRALVNNPHIILCDEPTGNLDSKNAKAIVSIFKMLSSEYNKTLIMVTHDLKMAAYLDKMVLISDGKIVERI